MVELSVIIPTLKDSHEIECLADLERGEFDDYEVIVRRDRGVAKARNEGISQARSDKFIFLDDDSRPGAGYLAQAAKILDEEAVVAGRIVHPRDDVFGRYFTDHYDHGNSPRYVDTFISCNMAIRREVFETVGLFDENFVWGHEEKELAERVRGTYDIYYDPKLVVEHAYADSLVDFWMKRYRQETQRPYYWHLHGISTSGQVVRTIYTLARPSLYAGETPRHTIAKSGVAVAVTVGRIHGILKRAMNRNDDPDVPAEQRDRVHEPGMRPDP